MSFYCPHCDTENSAGPGWRGMVIPCPGCLRSIKLDYRNGQSIPPNGYGVTFQDFCRLVDDGDTSAIAHPVIAGLLECRVERYADRFVLRQTGSVLIPFEAAHLLIQSDPAKQYKLYDLTMVLWR